MGFAHDLRGILKPISLWLSFYAISSLAFVGVYVYVDYQNDLSSYQETQKVQLSEAQSKIRSNIENLKKLSVLTSNRLAIAHGDLKRIQNILSSSYSLLPDSSYLKIEKVVYNKLSQPQSRITRFGALSLRSEQIPSETPNQSVPIVVFHETSIVCKNWVFDAEGNLEGFLEISLDPSTVKATLPMGSTLSFTSLSAHDLLQTDPFPIYGKISDTFWEHAIKKRAHYAIFFLFILFCLIAMTLSSYWLWWRIKKVYRGRIQVLKDVLSQVQANEEKAKTVLYAHQQRTQSHQISCQAYKKFQVSFRHHQRQQIEHILRSLDVVMNSYKRPKTELPFKDLIEIVQSCIKIGENLCDGVASKISNESINVLSALDNIQDLFTEKIHKSSLEIEINCSDNLLYYGDPALMELALLNVIGKPIHSVPPNGKVITKAINQKEDLHIQVKDNGFFFDKKILSQLNQSFDLFLPQEIFHKFCQENNLLYEHHRTKNGFNNTKISFPKLVEKTLESNVVPFFRNR